LPRPSPTVASTAIPPPKSPRSAIGKAREVGHAIGINSSPRRGRQMVTPGREPQVRAIGVNSSPRRGRQMDSPGREPRILRSASNQSQRKPRIQGDEKRTQAPGGGDRWIARGVSPGSCVPLRTKTSVSPGSCVPLRTKTSVSPGSGS
jgi:hypothetical protein